MSRKGRHTQRKVSKNRVRQEIEHMTLHPFMDAAEVRGWVMSGVCIDKHRDPMWASGKATCPVFGGEVWIGCDLRNIDREIKRRFRINPDLQRLPVGEVGTAVASGIVWNDNKANLAPEPCAPGYIPPNEIWAFTRLRSRSVEFRRLPKGLQDFFSTWMERAKDLSVKPLKDSGGKWPLLGHATKVWWKQGSLDELAQMREVRRILDEVRNQDSRLDLMTLLAMEEAEQEPLEPEFRAFPLRDYCLSHGVAMRIEDGEEGVAGLMEEYLFDLAFSNADAPQKQYDVAKVFFPLLCGSAIQEVLSAKKEESEKDRTGQHSPPVTLPGRHRASCRMFSDGESSSLPLNHCGVEGQTLCVLVDGSSAWGWRFSRGTGLGGMDEVVFAEPLPFGSVVTAEYVYSEPRQPTTVQTGPLSFVRGSVVGLTPAAACRELGRPVSLSELVQPEELPESLPTEISFSATLESVEEANGVSFANLCDVIPRQPAPISARFVGPGAGELNCEIEGWEMHDDGTISAKMTPRGYELIEQATNPVGFSISSRAMPAPSLADRPRKAMEKVAGIVEQGLQILASLGYEMPTEVRHDPPPIAEGVDFPDDWVVLFEDRLMGRWTVRVTPQEGREEERATA